LTDLKTIGLYKQNLFFILNASTDMYEVVD